MTNEKVQTKLEADHDAAMKARWTDDYSRVTECRYSHVSELVELRKAAKHLADKMLRLIETLDAQGADCHPNSLGEVQGSGAEVDRHCAIVNVYRNAVVLAAFDEKRGVKYGEASDLYGS